MNTQSHETAETPRRAFSNPALAFLRAVAVLTYSIAALIAWLIARPFYRRRGVELDASARWTQGWLRGLMRILGIRVTVQGPMPPPGVLLAPNHIGYLDVLAIGSAVPCHFVAKAEVESWPLIGALFTSSGHIGVIRKRASKSLLDIHQRIAQRLEQGDTLCVFLESTSTAGDRVMPFHGAFVQPAIDAQAAIVPVAIHYTATDPRTDLSEDIAYWKNHVFAPHAWRLAGLKPIHATVTFGPPIPAANQSRKPLAQTLRQHVLEMTGLPARDSRY